MTISCLNAQLDAINKWQSSKNCFHKQISTRFAGVTFILSAAVATITNLVKTIFELIIKPFFALSTLCCSCTKQINKQINPCKTAKITKEVAIGFFAALILAWSVPLLNSRAQKAHGVGSNYSRATIEPAHLSLTAVSSTGGKLGSGLSNEENLVIKNIRKHGFKASEVADMLVSTEKFAATKKKLEQDKQSLQTLQNQLDTQKNTYQIEKDKFEALKKEESTWKDHLSELQKRKTEIEDLEETLKTLTTIYTTHQESYKTKKKELDDHEAEIDLKEKSLETKEKTLREKEKTLAKEQIDFDEKLKTLEEQKKKIEKQKSNLDIQEKMIGDKMTAINTPTKKKKENENQNQQS